MSGSPHSVLSSDDMAAIEVVDFDRLPEDFAQMWHSGIGPFWLSQTVEDGDGFTRWSGVCLAHTWDPCLIDICPSKRYAYINAPKGLRLDVAREFVKAYGGTMYLNGDLIR